MLNFQIFTFAVGKPRTTTIGLQQIACNSRGNFLKVGELYDVYLKTFEFFRLINKNADGMQPDFNPKWSNSYLEEIWASHTITVTKDNHIENKLKAPPKPSSVKNRLIFTVSSPTYYQENKTGVVGMDIQIKSLVSQLLSLTTNGIYGILMNNRGNVIYHPVLKNLTELEMPFTTRFAELEQCDGSASVTAADIEKEIVSGKTGSIEASCLYWYSLQIGRGREYYARLQYHFAPIPNFPFYLVIVIPKNFVHQMDSSTNITNVPENNNKTVIDEWFDKRNKER